MSSKVYVCQKSLDIAVYQSGAGYYIGTYTEEDGYPEPMCRLSSVYYKTKEEAQKALDDLNFPIRHCMENDFCNGGKKCIIGYKIQK
jgi:hypothetical protein